MNKIKKQNIPQPTEHQIQNDCIAFLRYKGYYVQRMNSGRVPVVNKYGQRHMMQLNEPGTPDIMAFKKINRKVILKISGEQDLPLMDLLYIEVKRPGNMPTRLQEMKMKELQEYGARCFVVHSSGELQAEI